MSDKNKIVRVNFTMPLFLKEEWDEFAKNTLNSSTSQMVRNAVRDYRNKYKELERPTSNLSLELLEMKMQKMKESIGQDMLEFKKLMKVEKNEKDGIDEAKDSILEILEKLQPIKTKPIAKMIRMNPSDVLDILESMQLEYKLIKITKTGWIIDEHK